METTRRRGSATSGVMQEIEARIRSAHYPDSGKLPPERHLAEEFGTSRSTVRKALAQIEAQGLIWRHVGKGTFVGQSPIDITQSGAHATVIASPREIIEARLGIEPLIAGYAAHSAGPHDMNYIWQCVEHLEGARDWATFETWDRTFHRGVAVATHNVVFVSFLETINRLREGEEWLETRLPDLDSKLQRSNTAMHRRIAECISNRDMRGAARQMHTHLDRVRKLYIDLPVSFDLTAGL